MNGRRWTEDDDALLREMIEDGKPDDVVARQLGRTTRAMLVRCARIGVVRTMGPHPNHRERRCAFGLPRSKLKELWYRTSERPKWQTAYERFAELVEAELAARRHAAAAEAETPSDTGSSA